MLAHVSLHTLFVTIEGPMTLDKNGGSTGNFGVKPVKISSFSMLAHACSFVLTYSFSFTIQGPMMLDEHVEDQQGILA